MAHPGEVDGMVQEEDLLQRTASGRRTNEDNELREKGGEVRDNIRDALWNRGLRRPHI